MCITISMNNVVNLHKALLSAIGVGEQSATVIGATFQVPLFPSSYLAK